MPGKVQLWVDANPSVKKWFDKKANDSKNTAAVYASHLFGYWQNSVSPRGYKDIEQWAREVAEQQFSRDIQVKRRWGTELEHYWFGRGRNLATTSLQKSLW